uniref:Transposase n=1 Tax=Heterorhabditis bacteriophora TaxID=37862 RepID=A0A1I7W7G2_HETBA
MVTANDENSVKKSYRELIGGTNAELILEKKEWLT